MNRLKIVHYNQCDRKKCSGTRLINLGVAKQVSIKQIKREVVLSPFAERVISAEDKETFNKFGLVGMDLSWNKIASDLNKYKSIFNKGTPRALPFLVAANTVNFGKPTKLNTLEAIGSALWILGEMEGAEKVFQSEKYGKNFIELNYERLERYAKAKNAQEVIQTQADLMKELYSDLA